MTKMEKWLEDNGVKEGEGMSYLFGGLPHWGSKRFSEMTQQEMQNLRDYRWECINEFSFSVLTQEIVDLFKTSSKSFLEVGSGTGYWAWELSQAGVDIVATDPKPYTHIHYREEFPRKCWVKPEKLNARNALKRYPGRTLLMSWPCLGEKWAFHTLKAYTGDKFIYVGEWNGCCAEESFFELLEKEWKVVLDYKLRQWEGIHDYLWILERKQ